jgi:NAD(P)-dependent dehydrogenase (short-subunit alcohol dehydrogenase family)
MEIESIHAQHGKLAGKTALITGASRGMGRAGALLFAQHGADVVVNYRSDEPAAGRVVDRIRALGGSAIAVQADVGNLKDLPRLVDACLGAFGRIDILYHNAAIHWVCRELDDVTEEVWDRTYDCIVKGPFFLTKLVIPHMQKQGGGSIVFTSTSSAGTATPADPHYMTAKNAVNALYRILAGWLAPEIRVNCVVPGFVKTDMFRHHAPEMWDALVSTVPMNRMATPMDVAQAALYLVSPEAAYLTGVEIPVDGGRMSAIPRRNILPALHAMKPGLDQFPKGDYGSEQIDEMDVGL